jgi:hypothetical protein
MNSNSKFRRYEEWIRENSSWLALGLIGLAFALRFYQAELCYLNADEAMYFHFARPMDWAGAYDGSKLLAHPPLYFMILHGTILLGRSELALRLPSLIAGTVALWFGFSWLRITVGELAALAGLLVMALSPAAVAASTEVRPYGILLFFICISLYATERMFKDQSVSWAVMQGCFLLASMMVHYTALVAVASICAYTLFRSYFDGVSRRILEIILTGQVVLASALAWQYFTIVRTRLSFGAGQAADYLQPYYYAAGRETPIGFAWRMIFETFRRVTRGHDLAIVCVLIFLIGLAAIFFGRTLSPAHFGALIVLPFVVGMICGVLQIFPFAGSRHQAYLLPFIAAGLATSLTWVRSGMAAVLLSAIAIFAIPTWIIRGVPDNDGRTFPKRDMVAAIDYIHRAIPPGAPILVDIETRETLEYYLGKGDKNLDASASRSAQEYLGGYRVMTPREYVWAFRVEELPARIAELEQEHQFQDPISIVSVSWFQEPLASRLPKQPGFSAKEFGRISVIELDTRVEQPGVAGNVGR